MSVRLSDRQLARISEIFADAGILFLGSMVLPILMGYQEFSILRLVLGVVPVIATWVVSVILLP